MSRVRAERHQTGPTAPGAVKTRRRAASRRRRRPCARPARPSSALSRADIEARIPLLRGHPWGGGISDPLAGSLRIRRTLARARGAARRPAPARQRPRRARGRRGPRLRRARHRRPLPRARHAHRAPRARHLRAPAPAACVISPELYGLPVGSTGRYAIGMHTPGDRADDVRRPDTVVELECVSLYAPWLDAHGDGFLALQQGRVTAFHGSNLMKFGPLLGDTARAVGPRRARAPRSQPAPISITPVTASKSRPRNGSALRRSPRKATRQQRDDRRIEADHRDARHWRLPCWSAM